jgi:hypothetical protein
MNRKKEDRLMGMKRPSKTLRGSGQPSPNFNAYNCVSIILFISPIIVNGDTPGIGAPPDPVANAGAIRYVPSDCSTPLSQFTRKEFS